MIEQAALSLDGPERGFYARRARQMLAQIEDGPELLHAVLTLVSLAKRLDDAGNEEAADRLLDLASEAIEPLKYHGREARQLAEDLTRMKTTRLRTFEGDQPQAQAPKYGAKPKGTVALRTLLPVRPRRA